MEMAYLFSQLGRRRTMEPEAMTDGHKEKVRVTEKGAEACKNKEANWLLKWVQEEGVEDYIGRIVEVPKLVLDHVAGRVYRVQTESNSHFFAVVGYGRPCFYSEKKAVLDPREVLSLHRGSILITKMKLNYFREKRSLGKEEGEI